MSAPHHAPSLTGAVSELTALFCGFSQQELVIRVAGDAERVRISFESDNASESVQRALRDRSSTTQANAGIAFAESVLGHHSGSLELCENDGSPVAIHFVIPRHQ